MAIIRQETLTSFAARQFVLPARHRLSVKAGSGDMSVHRLAPCGGWTRAYQVVAGEEWSMSSDVDTSWQVGPTPGYAQFTIETPTAD